MNRRVWTLVFVLSISSLFTVRSAFPQGQTPSQRRAIDPPAKPTDSPVSLGMLVGDTLYISGRVGLDPKTGKVPDNLDDEMKNIFDDFKAELVQANMTMDDLVSVEVSASDLSLYDKFNAAYRQQFTKGFPARSFLGAASIFRGGHFEVSGIAVRRTPAANALAGSIVGTWALTAADKLLPNGTRTSDFGDHPHGLAIFTADGHYTVEIFTADGTNSDMSVHFRRYTVDPSRHTISFSTDRASFSDWNGTTQVRSYELKGDELSWKVPARPDGSIPITVLRCIAVQ